MNRHEFEELDLILFTEYDNPSIPLRQFDWSCVSDNYDGAPDAGPQALGRGATEQAAIDDWFEQAEELGLL